MSKNTRQHLNLWLERDMAGNISYNINDDDNKIYAHKMNELA